MEAGPDGRAGLGTQLIANSSTAGMRGGHRGRRRGPSAPHTSWAMSLAARAAPSVSTGR